MQSEEELKRLREVVALWSRHIADVFDCRGRQDVYSLEVLHTCHGCGGGASLLQQGLCERCRELIRA